MDAMSERWHEQLRVGLQRLGIALDDGQIDRLTTYLGLLEKWNRAFNLTAVRDPEHMVERHLLDSLAVLPYVRGARVADIGSGGGLPGIPLAVALPETAFVLVDTNGKKTRFLTQVKLELGLDNVNVVQSRVEQFRPDQLFDTVISRAFATLSDFWRGSAHLLKPTGRMLAMKAREPVEEMRELTEKTGVIPQMVPLVADARAERTLIILRDSSADVGLGGED